MAYKVNLRSFLQNPTGRGSASVARRDYIRRNLEDRYYVLYRNAKRYFDVETYIDSAGSYYFKMKIPSEFYYKYGLYYDVVIQFELPSRGVYTDLTLSRYQISTYSNSPNYQFTYAYVYNKDGNLIPFLKKKLSSKALTQAPKVRNPNESHGFEKSVYFACLYIREHKRLLTKATLKPKKLVILPFTKTITSSTAKLKEYNEAKKKYNSQKPALKTASKIKRHADMGLQYKIGRNTTGHKFKKIAPSPKKQQEIKREVINMNHGKKKIDMNHSFSVKKKRSPKRGRK